MRTRGNPFLLRGKTVQLQRWGIAAGLALICAVKATAQGAPVVHAELSPPQPQFAQRDTKSKGSLVTLVVKDSSLAYVLQTLAKQGKRHIIFNNTNPHFAKRVSVRIVKVSLDSAVALALKGSDLKMRIAPDGEAILIGDERSIVDSTTEKNGKGRGTIQGAVLDSATRKGVAGATVIVVGTRLSVVTRENGAFNLPNVPIGNQTLSVKVLGYQSKNIQFVVDSTRPITRTITLQQTATTLSGIVTTATGSQRKLEIGNDITTLNVPEIMKQAPITSVTDLLEGRVPGLTVMRTSGVPGAPSRIRLRGAGGGMLANVPGAPTNDPIVVVDGIRIYAGQTGADDQRLGGGKYPTQSPIDQIDPNSIEKIEVLRGPSASAMYGSDAANGVILVTTKKGQPGATHLEMTASGGTESMPGLYAAPGFYRFGKPSYGGLSAGGRGGQVFCPGVQSNIGYFECHVDSLVRFQALDVARLSTFGRGSNSQISTTASGGTSEISYSVTGSIANKLGLTKMPELYQDLYRQIYDSTPGRHMRRPNTLDTRSGQATFAANLSRSLTARFITSLEQSLQYQSSANAQLAPLASVYLDTFNINPAEVGEYAEQIKTEKTVVRHTLQLNLSRWERLPLTAMFGTDRNEGNSETSTPRGILLVTQRKDNNGVPLVLTEMSKGAFTERRVDISTITARVNGMLFPSARISLSGGAEVTSGSNAAIDAYSDTLVQGIPRPSALIGGTRARRSTKTGGWFLEPRLNLNSRFFVNPGFRFDGGGGSGSRSGIRGGLLSLFPKLNFSWIAIDREGGKPLWGAVSLLRPRVAFGVAGVQPPAEGSIRTFEQDVGGWTSTGHGIGDSIAPDLGLRLRSVGNTRLGREKTREVEGGFDLQLWETRLTVSATGFYKIRKNALQQLPLAPSVGTMINYYANIGHVRNSGVELSMNANVLDLPTIAWGIDVLVSKQTNRLTKLFGDQSRIDLGNGTYLVEGYPLFGRWARPISGWSDPKNGTKLWYGDYVVDDSAVYMGAQAPNFEMPVRTSVTLFHGLVSVNGQFNYQAGLTQYNLGGGTLLGNIYEDPNSAYGQQAYALAAACLLVKYDGSPERAAGAPCTDYGFIQKVNSLRFNSMSIGLNVPRAYLKRFPISSLSLQLQGSNLGLWTNYRGKDPNVNGSLIGDATQDSGQLPTPRTWSLRINIGT